MRITDKGNKTEAVVRSVKRYEFRLVLRTEDEFHWHSLEVLLEDSNCLLSLLNLLSVILEIWRPSELYPFVLAGCIFDDRKPIKSRGKRYDQWMVRLGLRG